MFVLFLVQVEKCLEQRCAEREVSVATCGSWRLAAAGGWLWQRLSQCWLSSDTLTIARVRSGDGPHVLPNSDAKCRDTARVNCSQTVLKVHILPGRLRTPWTPQ